jgi:hypothetical protein
MDFGSNLFRRRHDGCRHRCWHEDSSGDYTKPGEKEGVRPPEFPRAERLFSIINLEIVIGQQVRVDLFDEVNHGHPVRRCRRRKKTDEFGMRLAMITVELAEVLDVLCDKSKLRLLSGAGDNSSA